MSARRRDRGVIIRGMGTVLLVGLGGFLGSVDTRERLEAFLDAIDGAIGDGLATLEKAEVRLYRGRKVKPD